MDLPTRLGQARRHSWIRRTSAHFSWEDSRVLALFRRQPLDEQAFIWLRMFADQAASAITNAQALEDRTLAEAGAVLNEVRLRTLLTANDAIITNLSRDALLHAVSDAIRQVLTFDFAGIALYYPEQDAFRLLAVEGDLGYFRPGREVSREVTVLGGFSTIDLHSYAETWRKSSSIRMSAVSSLKACDLSASCLFSSKAIGSGPYGGQ